MTEPSFVVDAGAIDAQTSVTGSSQLTVQPPCTEDVTRLAIKQDNENSLEIARKDLDTATQNMIKASTHLQQVEMEWLKVSQEVGWFESCWMLASGRARRAKLVVRQAERQYRHEQYSLLLAHERESEERHQKLCRESEERHQKLCRESEELHRKLCRELEERNRGLRLERQACYREMRWENDIVHSELRREHRITDGELPAKQNKFMRIVASTAPGVLDSRKLKLPLTSLQSARLLMEGAIFYDVCEVVGGSIIAKCFLTGQKGDNQVVTMTHLLPRNTSTPVAEWLGVEEIDDPRNLIFLHWKIAKAFGEKKLCFLADTNKPRSFILKIWHEETRQTLLLTGSEQKIGDFEGKSMVFPEGKTPFSRVLSAHAQLSYATARHMGWIGQDEPKPDEYGSPLQDDTLTFEQEHGNRSSAISSNSLPSPSSWKTPQRSIDGDGGSQQSDVKSLNAASVPCTHQQYYQDNILNFYGTPCSSLDSK